MNAKDTFQIICSFLEPIELVSFRKLSKIHNKWADDYILKKNKSINLQNQSCPKCGHWISTEDISNYNEFYDYYLMDEWKISRFQQINEWFNKIYVFDSERKTLLCEDCEPIEDYTNNFDINFRYKGTREYTLVSFYGLYSWSALCIVFDERKGYWNEYRKVLSCTYEDLVKSEGYYGNSYGWDNWDDNEEDENHFSEHEDY